LAPWGLLTLAGLVLLFSNGRWTIPVAAWIGPVLLVRFVRTSRPVSGVVPAFLVLSAVWAVQFRGMAPLPDPWYFLLAGGSGLPMVLPYVADRLLAPRLRGFASTLVLPLAWATVEYVVSALSPYGSWGAIGYSQYGNLPLLQVLSVTGLPGIGFLIGWFASTANRVWETGCDWPRIRAEVVSFAGVLLLVLFGGGGRLVFFPPAAETVRVASLSRMDVEPDPLRPIIVGFFTNQPVDAEKAREPLAAITDDLLRRAEREGRAGARIVLWGEGNAPVLKADETALVERGLRLARDENIYLAMALATWNPGRKQPLENKTVLVTPEGRVAFEFWKARPVPGPEAVMSARDDGRVKYVVTPFGRIAAVICFDLDFPRLLAQAGRKGADILLAPSNDWRAIDPWHTQMASFRAIEQGFSLVRHTSRGLAAAFDYQGRVLAVMDHYQATDRTLVAQVPVRGVRTVYSRVGDLFAWLCLLGLLSVGFWPRLSRSEGE
jgi:apolipoprotein N-acyltransferase